MFSSAIIFSNLWVSIFPTKYISTRQTEILIIIGLCTYIVELKAFRLSGTQVGKLGHSTTPLASKWQMQINWIMIHYGLILTSIHQKERDTSKFLLKWVDRFYYTFMYCSEPKVIHFLINISNKKKSLKYQI